MKTRQEAIARGWQVSPVHGDQDQHRQGRACFSSLSDEQLGAMNYYVEGVIGKVPSAAD